VDRGDDGQSADSRIEHTDGPALRHAILNRVSVF
jgi:hypothetical protein